MSGPRSSDPNVISADGVIRLDEQVSIKGMSNDGRKQIKSQLIARAYRTIDVIRWMASGENYVEFRGEYEGPEIPKGSVIEVLEAPKIVAGSKGRSRPSVRCLAVIKVTPPTPQCRCEAGVPGTPEGHARTCPVFLTNVLSGLPGSSSASDANVITARAGGKTAEAIDIALSQALEAEGDVTLVGPTDEVEDIVLRVLARAHERGLKVGVTRTKNKVVIAPMDVRVDKTFVVLRKLLASDRLVLDDAVRLRGQDLDMVHLHGLADRLWADAEERTWNYARAIAMELGVYPEGWDRSPAHLSAANRQVDLTLGLHLAGDDTAVATESIIASVRAALSGLEVRAPASFVIREVDEPIHIHSVRSVR